MDYYMHAYGAKNSDHQIKNLPILTKSQYTKFNAHQIFPLYGITFLGAAYICMLISSYYSSPDWQIFHQKVNKEERASYTKAYILRNLESGAGCTTLKSQVFFCDKTMVTMV